MLQRGQRVSKMTKKVGQASPTGKVVQVNSHNVEVEWDDGHVSFVSPQALVTTDKASTARRR